MNYEIHYSCRSHVGKRRNENQDNFLCDGKYLGDFEDTVGFSMNGCTVHAQPYVFGVFDGMGGEEQGEMASLIAARCAANLKIGPCPIEDLQQYCKTANEEICVYADANDIGSMGTTAVIIVFAENEIDLCNIGDSKAFHFDGEKLEQISVDHCAATFYGEKPPLSQNLGIPPAEMMIEPHYARGYYHDGDIYLLCSDGLTDMVSIEEIAKILTKTAAGGTTDVNEATEELLQKALDNGGRDNITIILCRVKKRKLGLFDKIFHFLLG